MDNKILSAEKNFEIRFSEVDSMSFVWHGSYPLYFEDARESFGEKYGLGYMVIFNSGYYAPLVDLSFHYKKPLRYGMKPMIRITYVPTDAAKIIFDYEIIDTSDGSEVATGHSVQVFLDSKYQLVWYNPPFYDEWKKKWNVNKI
ncbi:MAG TPA: acyl-CoA thioesterase [Xylanibacter oryzae]|jgi:acyl-CoA thioester hydrolase|uniref:acyl-CoA thioesterase n=1 Tax=Xylanibacter oryzae TaxID=185293 RepID=UPI0004B83586|nr:acyl-CoA thioesterase [Xylanibacter oryzae]MBP7358723.1 acyl-CoA thioesterase [Prevotella sp.]HRN16644.1 acyl-CoA thioesterase [Xylanibacter oryzae]